MLGHPLHSHGRHMHTACMRWRALHHPASHSPTQLAAPCHHHTSARSHTCTTDTGPLPPAGAGEIFFETLAGLGYDHGSPDRVHPLQMLLTFQKAGIRMNEMSQWFWGIATTGLVPLAELLGFQAFYPKYVTAGGVKPASW